MAFAGGSVVMLGLLLGLGGGGNVPHDLASLVELEDYFSRGSIETKPEVLLPLAGKSPSDAKESFTQLLAIRWLGENAAQLGTHKEAVRKSLQQLAQGPEGFARDYAQVAQARVEGKPPSPRAFAKDCVRQEAFAWFPEQVMMAGAFDLRAAPGQKTESAHEQAIVKELRQIQNHLQKLIPNAAKDEIYIFAETVGNVRVDRVSYGFILDVANPAGQQIFARATGRFDHKRALDYLRQTLPNLKIEEKKGAKGEPLTFIKFDEPLAVVLVGDTDVLLAGHPVESGKNEGGNFELAEQALAVRDGKKPSMLKGTLAKLLEEVAPEAGGVVACEIPAMARGELARSPIGVTPHQFSIEGGASDTGGFTVRFRGLMDNDADAKKLVDGYKDLIKAGLEQMKNLPQRPEMDLIKLFLETIQGVELKAEGAKVLGELRITPDMQKTLIEKTGEAVKKETGG